MPGRHRSDSCGPVRCGTDRSAHNSCRVARSTQRRYAPYRRGRIRAKALRAVLLVVRREVFDAGPDATALEALNERRTEYPGHVRILGEVLEVAAAQR